ncbi:MAG: protease inhibitor I42 family protein [Burkholderiales bacterium]|nr:protease inhibitor I42 family protein [Burkholderiales bacterium]
MKHWSLAAAAVSLVAACAAPPPPPRPLPHVNAFGVHVAAEHSGSSITLERDRALEVRLGMSVAENREWELVDFAPGVLTGAAAPRFEREQRAANYNEAAGAAVWHFKATAAGTVMLKFEYRNPRTIAPASRTVNYTVVVP